MKKLFASIKFFVILSVFISCIDGTIQVNQRLNLKGDKGKSIIVERGSYQGKIKIKKKLFSSKRKLVINIDDHDKIEFQIPKGMRFPEAHGELEILSEQSGQPADLFAEVDTHYSSTPQEETVRNCSRVRHYKQCIKTQGNKLVRVTKSFHLRGDQVVVFHQNITQKFVTAKILGLEGTTKAVFEAIESSSNYIQDYASDCLTFPGEIQRFRRVQNRAKICPRITKPNKPGRE